MSTEQPVPWLRLHDGVEIPQLGFDLFAVPPAQTQAAVEEALAVGYRYLDTAAAYGNEKEAGAALAASGLPRSDYFLATKLWCWPQDDDSTLASFAASLERLGTEYVDLCLLHCPVPSASRFVDFWRTLERLRGEKAARTIGVSNFRAEDLELLGRGTEVWPTINQIELHPYCQEPDLLAWHAQHGVATAAWSPLGQGDLLGDEAAIVRVAESNGKTLTQVILRWHLQLGHVVVANSATPVGTEANIDILDFELSGEELETVGGLDSVLLR